MGPTTTPTRTLGMRLSCNFVNVYTNLSCTVHVHVYTRASPMDILARKSARRTKVRGQIGRAPRQADFRARKLARKSARKSMSVSVSVSVPWNLSLMRQALQRVPGTRSSSGKTPVSKMHSCSFRARQDISRSQ